MTDNSAERDTRPMPAALPCSECGEVACVLDLRHLVGSTRPSDRVIARTLTRQWGVRLDLAHPLLGLDPLAVARELHVRCAACEVAALLDRARIV